MNPVVGYTARSGGDDPIRHAFTGRRSGSRTARFAAECRATLATIDDGTPFDPGHPRSCPRCAKRLS